MTTTSLPADVDPAAGRRDVASLARGGSLNVVGAVCDGLLAFALVALITRGLGTTAAAGAFLQAVALFTILTRVAQLGAGTGLVWATPRARALGRRGELRRLVTVGLLPVAAVGVAVALLLAVFAEPAATLFAGGEHAAAMSTYLQVFAAFLPVAVLYNVVFTGTRGFGTMVPAVVVDNLARPVVQIVLVVAVFAVGAGTVALSLAYWLPTLLGLAGVGAWFGVLLRRAESRPAAIEVPARSLGAVASEFWRFSLPRAMAGVFAVTIQWLDTLFLGALVSASAAGIYAAGTRYLVVGTFFQQAIQQVLQPKASALLATGDRGRAQQAFQTTTGWSVTLAWPAYLIIAIFAPTLLRVFGEPYVAGQPALVILSLAWLFGTALGPVDSVLVMGGKSAWSMANLGAALTVKVVLNLVLIPTLGITGAALAWTASIVVHNLLPLAQVWRHLHLHPFGAGFRVAAPLALACYGGVGLLGRAVFGASLPVLAGTVAVASACYLAGLVRFRQPLAVDGLVAALRRRPGPAGVGR